MFQVIICTRDPKGGEVENWFTCQMPALPRAGDYISVGSIDLREPLSEADLIVRRVWWRVQRGLDAETPGKLLEVFVECDVAIGPYASRAWQQRVASERKLGRHIEHFDCRRIPIATGDEDEGENPRW